MPTSTRRWRETHHPLPKFGIFSLISRPPRIHVIALSAPWLVRKHSLRTTVIIVMAEEGRLTWRSGCDCVCPRGWRKAGPRDFEPRPWRRLDPSPAPSLHSKHGPSLTHKIFLSLLSTLSLSHQTNQISLAHILPASPKHRATTWLQNRNNSKHRAITLRKLSSDNSLVFCVCKKKDSKA